MKLSPALAACVLLALALVFGLVACETDSEEEPYRECVKDSDCGPGYVCKFQECHRAIPPDGDSQEDGDQETPVDGDEDDPGVDGDTPVDGDYEWDEDADPEWDGVCDEDHMDPRCRGVVSENFCRGNTIRHTVRECVRDTSGERLYECVLTFDCTYPNCGYVTRSVYVRACRDGCVSNENPEKNDYCAGEEDPEDGDVVDGDVTDGDTDEDIEIPNHQERYPCAQDSDCVLGLKCQLDWDADGRYCVRDDGSCVFHVGLPAEDPAILYSHADRVCVGNTYKRCSNGRWISPVVCPGAECEDGIQFEAQTCDGGIEGRTASCVPSPRVNYPCPGNLMCLSGSSYCRSTCTTSEHCRAGYICTPQNTCVSGG